MDGHIPHGSAPGKYIKRELDRLGLTQIEFARILGRPVQFVVNFCRASEQ